MKKLDTTSAEKIYGGWDFIIKIFGWEIVEHNGKRKGDKWHWWFE
jgi:hypothetical protein